ncbi:MAG: GGDEF domain-containing protein [Candidatus Gracilibacteria bacterium]|nr:GGDEF domain-containing protein [Candidatus Gracilibacteria bacterium]MDD2908171.1 GGDEF domain-containing protein [Candidatus Gracilibacteria bacterium]
MSKKTQNIKETQDINSIRLNADFIRELLIPLSTFVENIKDLEKVFVELAKILNMNHISLYKILDSGEVEVLSEYSNKINKTKTDNSLKKNINLRVASQTGKVSSIPMPNFGDNIVIPVGMDSLFLGAGDYKNSREIAKIENSLFELVAGVIANALRSMKLIDQANTDKLTGLLNRNALDKYIYESKNPFDRELPNPMALCMLDIDNFKRFNDTFGHNVGDKVLRHVADLCKSYFGDVNKVYRFGGEEITFIIHDQFGININKYIDDIRKKISETPLIYEGISYQVNASIGIYTFHEQDLQKKDFKFFALKFADQALYIAKEGGRNKISVYDRRVG